MHNGDKSSIMASDPAIDARRGGSGERLLNQCEAFGRHSWIRRCDSFIDQRPCFTRTCPVHVVISSQEAHREQNG